MNVSASMQNVLCDFINNKKYYIHIYIQFRMMNMSILQGKCLFSAAFKTILRMLDLETFYRQLLTYICTDFANIAATYLTTASN